MPSVPLERILPNPYQPESRRTVDEETGKKFGLSILNHGLLQTPVVRHKYEGTDLYYEIGDGWLRYHGYQWLRKEGHNEYTHLPVEEREITDQQMADMVLEANTIRKDLNPIEEALLFQRYVFDFGVSETKLAKDHNITQGAVSNTIRLLQLPEEIKQKVMSKELSGTHARQLLRLAPHPKMQLEMAERCFKHNLTVSGLDEKISNDLWYMSKQLKADDRYGSPVFSVQECESCEFRMNIARPYGQDRKEWRCTKAECWEGKNDAALKELAKEAKANLGKKGVKFLTSNELSYDQRGDLDAHSLRELDNPQECKDCDRTALYKHRAGDPGEPTRVCIDKACYRRKKTKKTKDTNKIKKEQDRALTEKLGEIFDKASDYPEACLRVITRHLIPHLSSDGKMDLCKNFECPTLANGRLDDKALMVKIDSMEIEELLQMAAGATVIHARRSRGYDFSTRLDQDLKRDVAMLTNAMGEHDAEVRKFREGNCQKCTHADEGLLPKLDQECCINNAWAKRIGDDGKCEGKSPKRAERGKAKPEKAGEGESEHETLMASLPCADCANNEECDRSHFYVNEEGGYTCDHKPGGAQGKPLAEVFGEGKAEILPVL